MIGNPVVPVINLGTLIGNFIGVAIIVAALMTLIYLIWGGFEWISSGGDKAGLEKARSRITNAFIGLVLVILAWAIISLAGKFLGFPFPNFSIPSLGGGGIVGGKCTVTNSCPDKNRVGESCDNTNRCDICGVCNFACCRTKSDCLRAEGQQECDQNNGYCQSGLSCNPNP